MKMIINGKKVDSVSGATFDVIAPATGEVIESVPKQPPKTLKMLSQLQSQDRRNGKRSLSRRELKSFTDSSTS